MNYQFYNPHPQQKIVGDCVKRSLTLATGKTYQEVSLELNRLKKETGSKVFNSNENWKEFVKRLGWKKLLIPVIKGESRINGDRFTKIYPKGTYLLRMAHHLVTVKDGVLYDTWDSREKCVYTAWKVS